MVARIRIALLLMIVLLALSGCTGPRPNDETPAPDQNGAAQDVVKGTANVERVEILMRESFPVQVSAVATGNLPDGCTKIGEVFQEQDGNTFRVTIETVRPKDQACTLALVPFEQPVPIDAVGLKAGKYTVVINGVSAEFELPVDNILE